MALQILFIRSAAKLKEMAETNLWPAQSRYKWDHDKKVQFKLTFVAEDCVFVMCPPLTMTDAERLAADNYS